MTSKSPVHSGVRFWSLSLFLLSDFPNHHKAPITRAGGIQGVVLDGRAKGQFLRILRARP